METKLLHTAGGLRTFAVVFAKGDDAKEGLMTFAREHDITAASPTAIGAFRRAVLAYFDRDVKEYLDLPIEEQVEVLSLVGDIALNGDEPEIHAHVVVGRRDGSTRGGHLRSATVWPTLEVIVHETPAHLRKHVDEETGLALLDLSL